MAAPSFAIPSATRGYDDVVFKGDDVFLSYTNPNGTGDPTLVELVNGDRPTGTLTTKMAHSAITTVRPTFRPWTMARPPVTQPEGRHPCRLPTQRRGAGAAVMARRWTA